MKLVEVKNQSAETSLIPETFLSVSLKCVFRYLYESLIAGAMFNWTCAFLVVYFYPMAETALTKYYCYFFFALICLLGAVFIIIFVPETKGKTEEDMKNYFMKKGKNISETHDNKGYE